MSLRSKNPKCMRKSNAKKGKINNCGRKYMRLSYSHFNDSWRSKEMWEKGKK
jgi:hypothetical protein